MRLMVERRVCPTRRRFRTPRRVYGENRCSEGTVGGQASVLGMGMDTVLDSAQAEVTIACAALKTLQTMDFWKIPELDLLSLAQSIEGLARLGYAAQVRVAGEVDTRHIAASFGSASTVALLRETLTISAPDARAQGEHRENGAPPTAALRCGRGPGPARNSPQPWPRAASGWSRPGPSSPPSGAPGTRTPGCSKRPRRSSCRPARSPNRNRSPGSPDPSRTPWTWTGNPTTTRPTGSS